MSLETKYHIYFYRNVRRGGRSTIFSIVIESDSDEGGGDTSSGDKPDGALISMLYNDPNSELIDQEDGQLESSDPDKERELELAQEAFEEVIAALYKNDEILNPRKTNSDTSTDQNVNEGESKSETKETANDKQNMIPEEPIKPDEEDSTPETTKYNPNTAKEGTIKVDDKQHPTTLTSTTARQEKVMPMKQLDNNGLHVGDKNPVEISIYHINSIVDRISRIDELKGAKDEIRSRLDHISSIVDKICGIDELKDAKGEI